MMRGLEAPVITPKPEDDGAWPSVGGGPLIPGVLRETRLKTLVASPRSWKRHILRKMNIAKESQIHVAVTRSAQVIAWHIAVGAAGSDAPGDARAVR